MYFSNEPVLNIYFPSSCFFFCKFNTSMKHLFVSLFTRLHVHSIRTNQSLNNYSYSFFSPCPFSSLFPFFFLFFFSPFLHLFVCFLKILVLAQQSFQLCTSQFIIIIQPVFSRQENDRWEKLKKQQFFNLSSFKKNTY